MGAIHSLSTEQLIQLAQLPTKKTKDIEWRGATITIKERLSLQEYMALVHKVLGEVQGPGDGNQALLYEMVDFALRANIIGSYAFVSLPKEWHTLFSVVYDTDLYECIVSHIDKQQLNSIIAAIEAYTGIRGGSNGSI